jgi:glutamate--cysteine ligase
MLQLDPHFFYQKTKLGHQEKGEEVVSFSVQMVLKEAEKLGMQWRNVVGTDIFEVKWHDQVQFFRDRMPITTSAIAMAVCMDKHVTKIFLQEHGIQVPKGYLVEQHDTEEYRRQVFDALHKPLVVKPTYGSHGDGISIGITEYDEYSKALDRAFLAREVKDEAAEVEEEFKGNEYRITVTPEKVIGVLHRIPSNVVGDGVASIRQLAGTKNQHPFRNVFGDDIYQVYGKVSLDDDALSLIKEQGYENFDDVPGKDEVVYVKKVSNMMAGGDAEDLTGQIHESVREICLHTIRAIPGLAIGGIDFMTTNLFGPQNESTYRIVEVNHNAEFGIHHFPMIGPEQNTAHEFLALLFPELKKASS